MTSEFEGVEYILSLEVWKKREARLGDNKDEVNKMTKDKDDWLNFLKQNNPQRFLSPNEVFTNYFDLERYKSIMDYVEDGKIGRWGDEEQFKKNVTRFFVIQGMNGKEREDFFKIYKDLIKDYNKKYEVKTSQELFLHILDEIEKITRRGRLEGACHTSFASKILHFFRNSTCPIWDSRVRSNLHLPAVAGSNYDQKKKKALSSLSALVYRYQMILDDIPNLIGDAKKYSSEERADFYDVSNWIEEFKKAAERYDIDLSFYHLTNLKIMDCYFWKIRDFT